MKITAAIAALAASVLWSVAGCDRSKPPSIAPVGRPLSVVASVSVIGDLVRQIGGPYVSAVSIVESGQSLNNFTIGTDTRAKLDAADLVIVGGFTEPWAIGSFDAPFARERLIRIDSLAATTQPNSGADAWLDPRNTILACREIGTRLATRRPTHDVYFRSQADRLANQIDQASNSFRTKFQALPPARLKVLAMSSEFDDLLDWCGIQADHSVTAPAGAIGDAEIRHLGEAAAARGIQVLLLPADAIPAQAADLSASTGLRAIVLDPYGSASIDGRASYTELMTFNLSMLLKAMSSK